MFLNKKKLDTIYCIFWGNKLLRKRKSLFYSNFFPFFLKPVLYFILNNNDITLPSSTNHEIMEKNYKILERA